MLGTAQEKTSDTYEQAKEGAQERYEGAKDYVGEKYEQAKDKAGELRSSAKEKHAEAQASHLVNSTQSEVFLFRMQSAARHTRRARSTTSWRNVPDRKRRRWRKPRARRRRSSRRRSASRRTRPGRSTRRWRRRPARRRRRSRRARVCEIFGFSEISMQIPAERAHRLGDQIRSKWAARRRRWRNNRSESEHPIHSTVFCPPWHVFPPKYP